MNLTDENLRTRLAECRDRGVDFIRSIEARMHTDNLDRERVWPDEAETLSSLWDNLGQDDQDFASNLRTDIRNAVTDIAEAAQRSVLIDEADLRSLSQNAKRMTASLHFKSFRSWGIYIHHNEGTYLGMNPPGQAEEWPLSPERARIQFLDAYQKIWEVLDFMSAKRLALSEHSVPVSTQSASITYLPGTAFIMMWINPDRPELSDVRDVAIEVFKGFGVTARRADDLQHSDGITARIIEEIKQSEFLFADLTGERPSVYYEVGFAHAIGKSVMLFRKKGTNIHFDLAYRNCPEYENLGDLRKKLKNRLQTLTNRSAE